MAINYASFQVQAPRTNQQGLIAAAQGMERRADRHRYGIAQGADIALNSLQQQKQLQKQYDEAVASGNNQAAQGIGQQLDGLMAAQNNFLQGHERKELRGIAAIADPYEREMALKQAMAYSPDYLQQRQARQNQYAVSGVKGNLTLQDEAGNLFSTSSYIDPNTQQTTNRITDLSGRGAQPVGRLKPVNTLGLTAEEKVGQVSAEEGAKQTEQTKAMIEREEKLQKEQLAIQKDRISLAKEQLAFGADQQKKNIQDAEGMQALQLADTLLSSDLEAIYGWGESFYPDKFRSQEGIDLASQRNQLVAILELGQAGKLKGQGNVTESERKILKEAATNLSNPDISVDLAKKNIENAKASISRTMTPEALNQMQQSQQSMPITQQPQSIGRFKVTVE